MKKHYLVIAAIWIVATALNIHKAFHIDDTFHLEAALWIKDHPATPMSGMINWDDSPTPMHNHNQPPLFFFLLAQVIKLTGTGEVPLHLFLSVFTMLSLIVFYRILRLLRLQNKTAMLLLFGLNPAFLVNQNLMTDIPLLLLLLSFMYFLLRAGMSEGRRSDYYIAAIFLATGLLIKYSLLPVIVVFLLTILMRRHYKSLPSLLVPAGVLTLWGMWNMQEFGALHFAGRSGLEVHINRFWSFFACLGAVATFIPFIAMNSSGSRWRTLFALSGMVVTLVIALAVATRLLNETTGNVILNYGFILSGIFLTYMLFSLLLAGIKAKTPAAYITSPYMPTALLICALCAFIILFAPFNATRHILLVLPFILLFTAHILNNAAPVFKRLAIMYTAFAGLFLGVSDYLFADYYRTMVQQVQKITETEQNIITTGHWGWQWYSRNAGYRQYSNTDTTIKRGDLFVVPAKIPSQIIHAGIYMHREDSLLAQPRKLSFIYTANAGWYSNNMETPPYIFSRQPIDTIFIYKVDSVDYRK